MHAPRKQNKMLEWMLRSQFFLGAFLFHLLIFIIIGSTVVFKGYIKPTDIFDGFVTGGDPGPVAPPQQQQSVDAQQEKTVEVNVAAPAPSNTTDVLAVDSNDPSAFKMNVAPVPIQTSLNTNLTGQGTQQIAKADVKGGFEGRAEGIREFTKGWGGGGSGGTGGATGKGTSLRAEFVCYVAKYADGDWNQNSFFLPKGAKYPTRSGVEDPVEFGSVPNLLHFINQVSHDRIKANVVGRALDLSSQEIFQKRPPFIYFTGHKDFKLTNAEVENLRKYLIRGGCIWGDNALAGRGSRFDLAFRREMKKVIPDVDKQFTVVPNTHPMYVNSFFTLNGAPSGINYCKEPVEVIELDGFMAVVYTLNNYGGMMREEFKEGTAFKQFETDMKKSPGSITFYDERKYPEFYRNMEPENCLEVYRFSTNLIEHMLTRFQERLQYAN